MPKTTTIRLSIKRLVVFFLIASIVFGTLNTLAPFGETIAATFTKKEKASSKTGTPLPFEEKEEEAKDGSEEVQSSLFFICSWNESTLFTISYTTILDRISVRSFMDRGTIPLYLTKRTLLI